MTDYGPDRQGKAMSELMATAVALSPALSDKFMAGLRALFRDLMDDRTALTEPDSDTPYSPTYQMTVAGDVGPATIKLIRDELDAHDADLRAARPSVDAYRRQKARLRLTTTVAALAADLGEEFVAKMTAVIEEFGPEGEA